MLSGTAAPSAADVRAAKRRAKRLRQTANKRAHQGEESLGAATAPLVEAEAARRLGALHFTEAGAAAGCRPFFVVPTEPYIRLPVPVLGGVPDLGASPRRGFPSFWYADLGAEDSTLFIKWGQHQQQAAGAALVVAKSARLPAALKAGRDPSRRRPRKKQRVAMRRGHGHSRASEDRQS